MDKLIQLDENIVCLNVNAETKEEVITTLFNKLKENNYVKDSFIEAILEREKVYPTGLPLASMGVAIPHTDPEHVLNPTIGVAVLNHPVKFHMMGSVETIIDADIVLVLAISEPSKQIVMLERLMGVFQNDKAMLSIKNASSKKAVIDILNQVNV
ncbi:PTS sugar transporter subunit IIA [Heyndrickxia sp. NPDC080065]|uniref:PTS sugar transporter subunit IIA n=1 Tax=Heyndrickxia sp. NPDC080065 TaxID=3390568 RepID=UPI003D07655B